MTLLKKIATLVYGGWRKNHKRKNKNALNLSKGIFITGQEYKRRLVELR